MYCLLRFDSVSRLREGKSNQRWRIDGIRSAILHTFTSTRIQTHTHTHILFVSTSRSACTQNRWVFALSQVFLYAHSLLRRKSFQKFTPRNAISPFLCTCENKDCGNHREIEKCRRNVSGGVYRDRLSSHRSIARIALSSSSILWNFRYPPAPRVHSDMPYKLILQK